MTLAWKNHHWRDVPSGRGTVGTVFMGEKSSMETASATLLFLLRAGDQQIDPWSRVLAFSVGVVSGRIDIKA